MLLIALAAGIFLARGTGFGRLRAVAREREAALPVTLSAGVYDTGAGQPVVVVRGAVSARQAVDHPVRVRVELLEGGRVVARGDALAGAVPTAEQVFAAGTSDGAAAVRALTDGGAVQRLAPGATAPFAVVLANVSSEHRLEVRAVAEEALPERPPP